MERKYQIKTMQKDIKEVRKRKEEPIVPTEQVGKPPGEPIPTEPMGMKKPLESPPPEPTAPRPKKIPGLESASPALPPASPRGERGRPNQGKLINRRLITIIILVAIVLLIGGGFYYWWNYLRAPKNPEPELPISLIRVKISKVLTIKEGEEMTLSEKLKGESNNFQEQNTFRRILVKKIGKEKDYFLSFKEISEILGITISTDILNNLGEHTLFFYSQEAGNRLGILNELSDSENLVEYLKSWEKTMTNDLEPIFLGQELNEPANEEFQDGAYQGTNIRYFNFSEPSLAIDYAVIEDYLIITTSRENMFKTIERILE